MRIGVETRRMNVGAGAGQHDAVDRIQQRADIGDIGRSRRTSAAARRRLRPPREDFARRPSGPEIDFRCDRRSRSRRRPASSSAAFQTSRRKKFWPIHAPARLEQIQHEGDAGLHCYFRVKASLGSIASPPGKPAALSAVPPRSSGAVQPGQFRLDSARHGLPERAAEIDRPETVRHHLDREATEPHSPCPDAPAHSSGDTGARSPGSPGSAKLTSTGISVALHRHDAGLPAHIVEQTRLPAGRLVGAQRDIVDVVEIERLVADAPAARPDSCRRRDRRRRHRPRCGCGRRGCSRGRDGPPERPRPV